LKSDLSERSFAFALLIVLLSKKLDEKPGVLRTLANQLLRGWEMKWEVRSLKLEIAFAGVIS